MDSEIAAEVRQNGIGNSQPASGRVVVDENPRQDMGYVEVLCSNSEEDGLALRYQRCGYIVYDTEREEYGYIYRQEPGQKERTLLGYTARPSAPNVPEIKGERSWKTLWMRCTLCAYEGRPEPDNTPKKPEEGKADEQKIEKPAEAEEKELQSPSTTEKQVAKGDDSKGKKKKIKKTNK